MRAESHRCTLLASCLSVKHNLTPVEVQDFRFGIEGNAGVENDNARPDDEDGAVEAGETASRIEQLELELSEAIRMEKFGWLNFQVAPSPAHVCTHDEYFSLYSRLFNLFFYFIK